MVEIWLKDKQTGIEIGTNTDGDLFFGNYYSGYNLPDTIENRLHIIDNFCRVVGIERPELDLNFKPIIK